MADKNEQSKLSLSIFFDSIKIQICLKFVEIDDNISCIIETLKEQNKKVKNAIDLNNYFPYYNNIPLEKDQPFRTLIKRHKMESKDPIKISIFNQKQKDFDKQKLGNGDKQQLSKKNSQKSPSKQQNIQPKPGQNKKLSSQNQDKKYFREIVNQSVEIPSSSSNQAQPKRVVVNKWAQRIYEVLKNDIQPNEQKNQVKQARKQKIGGVHQNKQKNQGKPPSAENSIQYKIRIKMTNLNNQQLFDVVGFNRNNTLQDAIQKIKASIQDYEDTQFAYALGEKTIKKQSLKQRLFKFDAKKKIYNGKQQYEIQLTMMAKYPGG